MNGRSTPWPWGFVWPNFSSLFREAITAQEARTGIERAHHLTAALYFGTAALEAFLNERMREHLDGTHSETEIVKRLRYPTTQKLKDWPKELLSQPFAVSRVSRDLITAFSAVRGELTHPKTQAQEVYDRLAAIDPVSVVAAVAEYMVRFHEAQGTRFQYWLFGWNYLNPRQDSYEIFVVNDQQFVWSLQALGFSVSLTDDWLDYHLGTFDGYVTVRRNLDGVDRCEPKLRPFPYRPTLCRRWWTVEHQRSCGNVTAEAIAKAVNRSRP